MIEIKDLSNAKKINDKCIGCNACTTNCPMMAQNGLKPKPLFEKIVETGQVDRSLIFSCTGCDYCSQVCPKDLDIKAFCYEVKSQSVAEEKIHNKQGHFTVVNFHNASTHPLFTYLDRAVKKGEVDTVFMPGCSLASSKPKMVQTILGKINEVEAVGLFIDCCGNPIYGVGDMERFEDNKKRLMTLFDQYGIKRLITACGNCYKTFSSFYDIEIIDLWQYIDHHSETFLSSSKESDFNHNYVLHDPCSYRAFDQSHQAVRSVFDKLGLAVDDFKHSKALTPCCGSGGMMEIMNPALAKEVQKKRVVDAGNRKIVSYCQSCVDGFRLHGNDGVHLLNLIFNEKREEEKKLSTPLRWINRRRARK